MAKRGAAGAVGRNQIGLREASLRLAYETAALLELVRTHEVHEGIGQHAAAAVICSRHESAKFRFCAGSRLL